MKLQTTPIALAAIALFSVAPLAAEAAPTVSFRAPAAGATITQDITQTSQCEATGLRIDRVTFSLRRSGASAWTTLNTEGGAPYRCNLDPRDFTNGDYTLRAVARDSSGATATATRNIRLNGGSNTPPTLSISAPGNGATVKGTVSCGASASDSNGIRQVQFYLDGSSIGTDTGSPYTCSFDSTKLSNGSHTLRAVATDTLGGTSSREVSFSVNNTVANTPPSVAIMKPASGATLSAPLNGSGCEANASDPGGSVKKVDFFLSKGGTSTPVGSKTAAPYQCAIDTAKFADGDYTLMAVATDNLNMVASAQRPVTIKKPGSGGGGGTSPIDPAHILTHASADMPFSQQSGYTAQVINTYTSASQIPESGIHGTTLPNGETLRFGKTADPSNSLRKALAFQVRNSDPLTSKGMRAEISAPQNIEMNEVYWIAFSAYIHDWGTLASTDSSLFGTQVHSGDNALGLSPSFSLYTRQNGRAFQVQARYSEAATPSQSNSTTVRYAEYPIPFHQWTDFVLKFKHNTSGNGFLQVWMNGQMIANYQGSLGFNTPGMKDYAKFGYYNWTASAMNSTPRNVLLRAPTLVADPTGQTYSAEQVRTLLSAAAAH